MKVVIIEDQAMVRDMLLQACREAVPSAEILAASTGAAGVEFCRTHAPELVILDLGLPDADGLDLLPEIHAASRSARIVVLSGFTDEFTVHRALKASVHGFLDKNEQPLGELGHAIREVLAGRQYLSSVASRVRDAIRKDPLSFAKIFSEREEELLSLFGRGYDNDEVANRTGISAHTVKVHRRNIMAKLGIHSTPELMRYAVEKGFTRLGRVAGPFTSTDS